MIATGGIYRTGQISFHYRDDASYRAIPSETNASDLRATHFAYDLSGAREDINVVFPIKAMKALKEEGHIGAISENFFTCMGGIYSQRSVQEELAPNLVERCLQEEVDAVLLVPV
jgi:D-proline reductase (dithiol) PrdB